MSRSTTYPRECMSKQPLQDGYGLITTIFVRPGVLRTVSCIHWSQRLGPEMQVPASRSLAGTTVDTSVVELGRRSGQHSDLTIIVPRRDWKLLSDPWMLITRHRSRYPVVRTKHVNLTTTCIDDPESSSKQMVLAE